MLFLDHTTPIKFLIQFRCIFILETNRGHAQAIERLPLTTFCFVVSSWPCRTLIRCRQRICSICSTDWSPNFCGETMMTRSQTLLYTEDMRSSPQNLPEVHCPSRLPQGGMGQGQLPRRSPGSGQQCQSQGRAPGHRRKRHGDCQLGVQGCPHS